LGLCCEWTAVSDAARGEHIIYTTDSCTKFMLDIIWPTISSGMVGVWASNHNKAFDVILSCFKYAGDITAYYGNAGRLASGVNLQSSIQTYLLKTHFSFTGCFLNAQIETWTFCRRAYYYTCTLDKMSLCIAFLVAEW
jgi:hypothetical protein